MNERSHVFDHQVAAAAGRIIMPLTYLAMAICFSVRLREFLSRSFAARYNVDLPYLILLLGFAVLQEVRLWARGPAAFREITTLPQDLFVVGWWLFYLGTLATASHVAAYKVPENLLTLCMQVTAIYLGTLVSHFFYEKASEGRFSLMGTLSQGFGTLGIERSREQAAESRQKQHVA